MSKTTCPTCGKTFRFAASLDKYHGWCYTRKPVPALPAPATPAVKVTMKKPAIKVTTKASKYDALFLAAEAAASAAYKAATPTPMIVEQRENPLDDNSRVVHRYAPVMDGVCGFGWVHIKGGTAFANAAKARYGQRRHEAAYIGKGYPTGLDISPMDFSQSYERKMAWARAYAGVLKDAGIDAYADGRLD